MKQGVTWPVVGAVAVVGLAAAVDALRGSPESVQPTTEFETRGGPAANTAGLEGVLYYTGEEDCILHGVRLPELDELESAQVPLWENCEFSLSPTRTQVAIGGSTWERRGNFWARAIAGGIWVTSATTRETLAIEGTAPAFTRFGNLTFARDGAIHVADPECVFAEDGDLDPCSRMVIGARELLRVVRQHASIPVGPEFGIEGVTVEQAVWLDADRLAFILAAEIRFVGRFEALMLFDDSGSPRLVEGGVNAGLSDLAASPRGNYVAVSATTAPGLALFDQEGNAIPLPSFTELHAIAWSPGDTWTAVATRASIFVFRAGRPDPDIRRLQIAAADLAWR